MTGGCVTLDDSGVLRVWTADGEEITAIWLTAEALTYLTAKASARLARVANDPRRDERARLEGK